MIEKIVTNRTQLAIMCNETTIGTCGETVRSLLITAEHYKNHGSIGCAGLAAPQIGSTQRVFVMWLDNENLFQVMINPEIVKSNKRAGKKTMVEACLSRPQVMAKKTRHKKIKVKYIDEKGVYVERNFSNFNARVFQHELDHLNGITI